MKGEEKRREEKRREEKRREEKRREIVVTVMQDFGPMFGRKGGGGRRLRPIYNLLSAMRHAIGDATPLIATAIADL